RRVRLATPLLPDGRGLRADVQAAHRRDGVGPLRLRPRRALHELYGALRLRSDGRKGDDGEPARRHPRGRRRTARTWRPVKTLIVAPMSREARAIPREVFVCGSGADAPHRVVSAVEASGAEVVIVAGLCGGLDPSLGPGSLILGRRLVAEGEAELTPSHALLETARR